jgi:polyisoprenoid-binding protein YceI
MRQLIASLALTFLLVACPKTTPISTTPVENTPVKTTENKTPEVKPEVKDIPTTPTPITFVIKPENSSISFVGSKTTRTHVGKFGAFIGEIYVPDKSALEQSLVKVEITMSNFATDETALDKHLKTADFFDVEKFPVATFTSTSVTVGGVNGATHTVTGNLSFHGVTRSLAFPANISIVDNTIVATSEFTFSRKEFGVSYPGMATDPIKDEVVIKLELKATPK